MSICKVNLYIYSTVEIMKNKGFQQNGRKKRNEEINNILKINETCFSFHLESIKVFHSSLPL